MYYAFVFEIKFPSLKLNTDRSHSRQHDPMIRYPMIRFCAWSFYNFVQTVPQAMQSN